MKAEAPPGARAVAGAGSPAMIGRGLAAAAAALAATSDTPRLDAELLMAHALGMSRDDLILRRPPAAVPAGFDTLVARRLAGEPIAYITGRRGFWTIELDVGPGVLIPRGDSETLIEAAIAHFGAGQPRRILDLGTGPGTLLLAALDQWREASGIGVDRSATALGYARRNARRLGMAARAAFREGDWGDGLTGRFDLVLCNPPYVADGAALGPGVREYEPAEALFAGADGLADYRRLARQLPPLIAPAGAACIELGAGQADAVMALFADAGLTRSLRGDLNGHARCLILEADFGE